MSEHERASINIAAWGLNTGFLLYLSSAHASTHPPLLSAPSQNRLRREHRFRNKIYFADGGVKGLAHFASRVVSIMFLPGEIAQGLTDVLFRSVKQIISS